MTTSILPHTALRRSASTPPASSSWWASFQDEAVSFFKGDNNAPWAILAETVIGCVPVLGQIVDARDIIKGLVEVSAAPTNPLAWFNLITAVIGLVPGGGDAAKRSLRAVKAGTANVDDLLAMIRRLYKGDPELLLRKVLDVSVLRSKLDEILTNPRLLQQLQPGMRRQVNDIRQGLGKQFDNFKKEVDGWLAKGRKTSADTGGAQARRSTGTPEHKPNSSTREGKGNPSGSGNNAQPRQANAATQRTARFKQLSQKVLGVMGEHMADYHCQEVKDWGDKAVHDQAQINSAKLNDDGRMVQLWPCVPRGRGIDAVWKSTGHAKPYAVIEAKASYDPTKSLRALLGEAADKSERGGASSTSSRSGRSGRSGSKGSAGSTTSIRQTNGKVTQMGHGWIERRLPKALSAKPSDLAEIRRLKSAAYTRHVFFFSIPHAVAHAEALILHVAKKAVNPAMHAAHQTTREWTDAAIDKVVDNRAGLINEGRNRK